MHGFTIKLEQYMISADCKCSKKNVAEGGKRYDDTHEMNLRWVLQQGIQANKKKGEGEKGMIESANMGGAF
jgi:hypothetical protein